MARLAVTVRWGTYTAFDPGVDGPVRDLPRPAARAAFVRLMEARHDRIDALRLLARANGFELSETEDGVQALEDWFRANVEADPAQPRRMRANWHAVAFDIALFLGELMIARSPNLHWEFFTWGRKDVAYQSHVIMGFRKATNPKYNVELEGLVVTYGIRVIAGLATDPKAFVSWLRSAQANA